jgi:hypothetical protein
MRGRFFSTLFIAVLAASPALAAGKTMSAAEQAAYDEVMSNCVTAMIGSDHEMAAGLYDGEGFAWSEARDNQLSSCRAKEGFSMPFTPNARVGGGNMYDPDAMTPEQKRADFRAGILQYGGPELMQQIDDFTARAKAQLAADRGQPVDPAAAAAAKDSAGKPSAPAPGLTAAPPPTSQQWSATKPKSGAQPDGRKYIYVPGGGTAASPIFNVK